MLLAHCDELIKQTLFLIVSYYMYARASEKHIMYICIVSDTKEVLEVCWNALHDVLKPIDERVHEPELIITPCDNRDARSLRTNKLYRRPQLDCTRI